MTPYLDTAGLRAKCQRGHANVLMLSRCKVRHVHHPSFVFIPRVFGCGLGKARDPKASLLAQKNQKWNFSLFADIRPINPQINLL